MPFKKIINFSFLLVVTVQLWAQEPKNVRVIEAKDIPVDTTQTASELVSIDNILINSDSTDYNTSIDFNQTLIPVIQVPIFNLQDDPYTASVDAKWMDLIRNYDQFDSSAMLVKDLPGENVVIEDLPTDVLKQRLAEIDARTPFNVTYNPELERIIKSFLKNRGKAISNLMAKSKYYFPIFEQHLENYDVPIETKYLAIVESALQPKARSRAGASGLWQFMYGTGKQYGLDVSSYVDERQNPIRSSEAAAKHLSDLYDIFEDWDLALAAYNSGAGNVNKAIRRSGGKRNYWNLRPYLPRETANYVPIFYATLYLFEYGHLHNIYPDSQFNLKSYETDTIQVKRQISFEQIQTTTGIDISLLEFLNPSYKINVIPYSDTKNYELVLPREFVGIFVQNEDKIYEYVASMEALRESPAIQNVVNNNYDERTNMATAIHRVKRGEVLGKIADKYNVTVKQLISWNHLKSSKVFVGQKIKIHKNSQEKSGANEEVTSTQETNNQKSTETSSHRSTDKYVTYTVKHGDTLWSIANKFPNVSVDEIKKWNKIDGNKLVVGKKLKIYKG